MSSLIDEYTKNKSPEDKKEVERRVREMTGNMSELSALMLVLEEMRQEGKKDGGIMSKRVGFRIGSDEGKDVSGREYGTTSAASMGVATSPSRDDSDDTFTNGGNNNNPVVDIGKAIATNTVKTYAKNKAIEKLGLGGIMSMSPQIAALLGIINSIRNPQINEEDMKFANGGRIGFQEGTPKTTMVGNLKITVKPNESTEMAVLNALMNDIEGVVDDETKQDYYKILMPQLRNQMSKSRYEGLMGELFGRKDGGIGYLLGE